MTADDDAARPAAPDAPPDQGPASSVAAAAALEAIGNALREAQNAGPGPRPTDTGPEQALASLLLLREVRERLAGWEPGLIETAREAGASWAELARPLGVASRQAAERRYLRLRPGPADTTGEQRVQAVRDRRAADRTVTRWARGNAADLRQLAGQVTALTDLPAAAETSVRELSHALGRDDAAQLVAPLTAARDHLGPAHTELADRIDTLTQRTRQLRDDSDQQRAGG